MKELKREDPMSDFRRPLYLAAALLFAVALFALAPSPALAEAGGFRCKQVTFPVTLSPADSTVYDVAGSLCAEGSLHRKTLQITIHGGTYSRIYWDWPYQPDTYSYLRRATAAGYAVLNIDRIGNGQSGRPPAEAVDFTSNAYVVHQIVQALRGGDLVVPSFGRVRAERVVLVGHSMGSFTSVVEAGTYGDVDGVVVTGALHSFGPDIADVQTLLYPASLDPLFAGQDIPDGYLTTLPGTRGGRFFYRAGAFDPQVLALDEQTKDTVTTGELTDLATWAPFTAAIRVPVLVVVGDYDTLFCADPGGCTATGALAAEAAFYSPEACAELVAIPETGHDLNLHFSAPATYGVILEWIGRRVGDDPRAPAPQPCAP
jgi:pimeloyl-ACP methyl ester carboxylesterase